jgi:hypothetical protein
VSTLVQYDIYFWPIRKREDIIKMELRKVGWGGIDWIHLAEDILSINYNFVMREGYLCCIENGEL